MALAVPDEIVASPRLPQIVGELTRLLEAEVSRRARFRDELTDEIKAEFINGEVIVHSPARFAHLDVVGRLASLLRAHASRRRLGVVTVEKQLVCLTRNDYEPDIAFFGVEKTRLFGPETREFPAPDLVVEVLSESTAARDRGVKIEDYAAHGVSEYWIVDPDEPAVEQYLNAGDRFQLHRRVVLGDRLLSRILAGFDVPVAAVFRDDENPRALATIVGPLEAGNA